MGIGQGNGLSLSLWALISTILLDMIVCVGHSITLSSAISQRQLHLVGFGFVDDANLVTPVLPPTPQVNRSLTSSSSLLTNGQEALLQLAENWRQMNPFAISLTANGQIAGGCAFPWKTNQVTTQ